MRAKRSRESWNSKLELFDLALATTAELVVAAQDGDNEAFGELVSRFERMVQAVCWQRLRNHAEAQEAAQEVFIKALAEARAAQGAGGVCRLAAGDRGAAGDQPQRAAAAGRGGRAARARRRRRRGGEGPLGSLLARERVDQLHEGLDRLATLDRSTLVAFYIEGQSLIEMSDEFAAPVGTIKRRLHVARKRLAKELECLQAV